MLLSDTTQNTVFEMPPQEEGLWLDAVSKGSVWLDYEPTRPIPVMSAEETLTLSPSSLETYLRCPRQFFYQTMLGLRDESDSLQATVGKLVHRILEVFNRRFQENYTFSALQALTQQVLDTETEWAELESLGFKNWDLKDFRQLAPIQQQQIKQDILQAFQALDRDGYFNIPFESLRTEEALALSPTEIPGFCLKGRTDLIREKAEGTLEIIDYKTSRTKYQFAKLETNLRGLLNALQPIDWEIDNVHERYKDREYQLPLYWLIAQSMPEHQAKPTQISLQVVRPPKLAGNPPPLTLSHEALLDAKPHLMDLLKRGIADPIRMAEQFVPLGNRQQHCKFCAYVHLCEGPQGDEGEEAFE
jgi:PD-(D/E)XK nuclease superfamily